MRKDAVWSYKNDIFAYDSSLCVVFKLIQNEWVDEYWFKYEPEDILLDEALVREDILFLFNRCGKKIICFNMKTSYYKKIDITMLDAEPYSEYIADILYDNQIVYILPFRQGEIGIFDLVRNKLKVCKNITSKIREFQGVDSEKKILTKRYCGNLLNGKIYTIVQGKENDCIAVIDLEKDYIDFINVADIEQMWGMKFKNGLLWCTGCSKTKMYVYCISLDGVFEEQFYVDIDNIGPRWLFWREENCFLIDRDRVIKIGREGDEIYINNLSKNGIRYLDDSVIVYFDKEAAIIDILDSKVINLPDNRTKRIKNYDEMKKRTYQKYRYLSNGIVIENEVNVLNEYLETLI